MSRATKPSQPERLSRALDRHSATLAPPTAYGLAVYMSCFRTALLICFCLVSVLRANPTHRIGELGSVPVFQSLHESSSQITTSKTNGKLCSSSDRLCKLHRETQDFYMWKRGSVSPTSLKVYGEIAPISVAAPYVKAFFDAIAAEASNAWTSRSESTLLTVTQGPFQLTVSCLGTKIPWPFLVSAAEKFSSLADRFWVNTFDAYFEDTESDMTIAISLRLLKEARALGAMTLSQPGRRRNLQSRKGLPAPPTPPLRPRAPNPSSSMSPGIRIASFVHTTALVPGVLAASKLEDFYTIIATKVETGYFADRAPSKTVAFLLWDFELIFSCDKINVPWSFVQAFAIDMAEWSSRHFTGFYEATGVGEGPLSGLVIFVQMRLRGKGRGSLYLK